MTSVFTVKVDVIVALHNAESTIEQTIQSAMLQEVPAHLVHRLCNCAHRSGLGGTTGTSEDDGPSVVADEKNLSSPGSKVHFDICICCYDDASTDRSLDILRSLGKERTWSDKEHDVTMQTKLLIGTSPSGTTSRGAGYARNQAAKLRGECKENVTCSEPMHFLCILDSDDIMHPYRIAEQTCAMLSLESDERQKTLMGCQFDRIPQDSTQHYTQWANSLSDERLYLEQFRECTLIQPTWFLPKLWFDYLGGYLEAPPSSFCGTNEKRAKLEDAQKKQDLVEQKGANETDAVDEDFSQKSARHKHYRLFHTSEVDSSNNEKDCGTQGKRKMNVHQGEQVNTLRLAEDLRFFYAHMNAGGRLHLHRTPTPLVSYRHRSGMSQSSNTPRKLLLKLRTKAFEDLIFSKDERWPAGFAIWGAGRDGKDFIKALSPTVASKVVCFVDVDQKKIEKVKWYANPSLSPRKIPILHFSVLAKALSKQTTFGRIDKKCASGNFDLKANPAHQNESHRQPDLEVTKKKKLSSSIDPAVLQELPVVVCVAMYRTNGALESNVASISRVEGRDLWHII
ncbi:hypothetical protein ACHAWF_005257 [Thalassiosira exigua]